MKILRQMPWNIANFASTNKNYDVHSSVLVLPWCVQLVGTTLTSTISQNIHIVTTPCRKVPKFHSDSPIHACINYRLYSLSLHCHMNKHFTVTILAADAVLTFPCRLGLALSARRSLTTFCWPLELAIHKGASPLYNECISIAGKALQS